MAPSDIQIERYSRQIIVPRIGGRGQERLLAARVAVVGSIGDIEAPLGYLVGAGVGTIAICAPNRERATVELLAGEMRSLNPEARVSIAELAKDAIALLLVGDSGARTIALEMVDKLTAGAFVVARLDSPGLIAVLPDDSPCPRCADPALLAPFGARCENADFIALAAAAEVLKLAAGFAKNREPVLIAFDSYRTRARRLASDPRCACVRRKGKR
ncbi:MAG: hypothetical protein ACREQI_07120 [Candidatus Binataceae bacterium]